jgi:hypothetical protein
MVCRARGVSGSTENFFRGLIRMDQSQHRRGFGGLNEGLAANRGVIGRSNARDCWNDFAADVDFRLRAPFECRLVDELVVDFRKHLVWAGFYSVP